MQRNGPTELVTHGMAGRKQKTFTVSGRFRLRDMGVGRRERQWRGVREEPTEDPVKNGASFNDF